MSSPPDTNVEIDRENWGKIKINPDSKNITAAQINSYILWTIQVYKEMKYRDTELCSILERISRDGERIYLT
ncbi:Atp-dependent dna helicase [Thalictrum thalictroides]|uniref:Atp-dependent dna helicase n=1 Tax=Thalictrum thalictroides TaxID=46969 RepID=A0A7J6V0B1_THATH|nr:Atp-dependent dna helicase [Thalictrum thalictroides]